MNEFNKNKRKPSRKPNHKPNNSSEPSLKIIPISGLEAIGKNMTLIEYGNDMGVTQDNFEYAIRHPIINSLKPLAAATFIIICMAWRLKYRPSPPKTKDVP